MKDEWITFSKIYFEKERVNRKDAKLCYYFFHNNEKLLKSRLSLSDKPVRNNGSSNNEPTLTQAYNNETPLSQAPNNKPTHHRSGFK